MCRGIPQTFEQSKRDKESRSKIEDNLESYEFALRLSTEVQVDTPAEDVELRIREDFPYQSQKDNLRSHFSVKTILWSIMHHYGLPQPWIQQFLHPPSSNDFPIANVRASPGTTLEEDGDRNCWIHGCGIP